jgi:hypothetical protein
MFLCMEVNLLRNVVTAVPADAPARARALHPRRRRSGRSGRRRLVEEECGVILRGFRPLIDAGLRTWLSFRALPRDAARAAHAGRRSGSPYDILHFIGHGQFDAKSGMGELIFEDARARSTSQRTCSARSSADAHSASSSSTPARRMGIRGPLDFTRGVADAHRRRSPRGARGCTRSSTRRPPHFASIYWACLRRRVGRAARARRDELLDHGRGDRLAVPCLRAIPRNLGRPPASAGGEIRVPAAAASAARIARSARGRRHRVGVWDVNHIAPHLEDLLQRFNQAQDYFEFVPVEITAPLGTWRRNPKVDGAFLNATEVEEKLADAPARLGVDHLYILTNFALSDGEVDDLTAHVSEDRQISIASTFDRLDRFAPPELSLEHFIANHLAFNLSKLKEHKAGVESCPVYYNEGNDLRWIAGQLAFCGRCRRRIQPPELLAALGAVLAAPEGGAAAEREAKPTARRKRVSKRRRAKRSSRKASRRAR